MSDCQHDERFSGVFFLPKETGGCLACMAEQQATALEAKDAEIERLRASMESIANNTCCEGCQEARRVAAAALNTGEQDDG